MALRHVFLVLLLRQEVMGWIQYYIVLDVCGLRGYIPLC
jgi:hypothetical protein